MATKNEKKLGYLDIFHVRPEDKRLGGPDYEGRMKTEKGTYYVKLWLEHRPNLTNGEMLKGYVYSVVKDEE